MSLYYCDGGDTLMGRRGGGHAIMSIYDNGFIKVMAS